MPVASMAGLLQNALDRRYAIGYFESWDQYSLEGSIEAAERLGAPAIIGFGAAVCNQQWLNRGALEDLARMARRMAERASVPTAVLFNEARDLDQIAEALDAGCDSDTPGVARRLRPARGRRGRGHLDGRGQD